MPQRPDSSSEPSGLERNLRLFVLFRLFFNARFYYPIFLILFYDFELTAVDFYILNGVVWTLASIVLEVPSGALADRLGRKTLIVTAAVLMIAEMAVLCVTPLGGGALVFGLFMLNRILSGAAEAAASGADEALAYDSIPESERETRWPKVQSQLMVVGAIGMIIAINLGAAIYRFNDVAAWLGQDWTLPKEITIRAPFFLCLATSAITLIVTLLMKEPPRHETTYAKSTVSDSFRRALGAGRWILSHSAPFLILLIFVLFDSIVRLFYTVGSSYYRVIDINAAFYGLIGTLGNLVAIAIAPLITWLIANRSANFNYRLAALFVLGGLIGLAYQIPIWGFLVLLPLGFGMRHIHAATSHYLNRVTDSAHRATVLSFRGLAMMLFYGLVNVGAILQITAMKSNDARPEVWKPEFEDEIIRQTSPYWWMWFVAVLVFLTLFRWIKFRKPIDQIIA